MTGRLAFPVQVRSEAFWDLHSIPGRDQGSGFVLIYGGIEEGNVAVVPAKSGLPMEQEHRPLSNRIAELGLLFACPFDETSPRHCRLHDIRKLPEAERAAVLRNLSADEAETMIDEHQDCRCWRENRGLPGVN